jgi:hypothetical protein
MRLYPARDLLMKTPHPNAGGSGKMKSKKIFPYIMKSKYV